MVENDLKDFIIARNVIRSYRGTKSRVVIPNGIKGIGPAAFYQNDNITSVIMPDSVVSVSKKAFSLCSNLKSVRFSRKLKRIETEAFANCPILTNVTLYRGLEVVRPRAFFGCHNIRNIFLPESLKEIGRDSFVDYGQGCTIHTPLGSKGKEYAVVNNFATDQKNPPKRQYEAVLPNENNYLDPEALHYYKTGNYGISDDEADVENEELIEEEQGKKRKIDDSTVVNKTMAFGGQTIDEKTEIEKEEEEPADTKKTNTQEKPKVQNDKTRTRRKLSEKRKQVIWRGLICLLVVGILFLGINFVLSYRNEQKQFDEALAPDELIIPFNMAYNYAVHSDASSFLTQIRYLGLDIDSKFGCQINQDFIDQYLQNGSFEGFLRRFATIYNFGITQEKFNTEAANETIELFVKEYMVVFTKDYLEILNDVGNYHPEELASYHFYQVEGEAEYYLGLKKDDEKNIYNILIVSDSEERYRKALKLFDMGRYDEAQLLFEEIAGYEDANDKLLTCKYRNAVNQYENENYALAYTLLEEVVSESNNGDASLLLGEVKEKLYKKAMEYYEKKQYDEANEIFNMLDDYKDSQDKIHLHEYSDTVLEAPTCENTGLLKHTCACGKTVTEIIPALGHSYETTTVCTRCGYDYAENIRVIADCIPYDIENFLWGENHYIVSCSHKVTYNKEREQFDLAITWTNSDSSASGYGSLTYYLVANIYDREGNLIKRDKDMYFKKGLATTYVFAVEDNMDYYVDLKIYRGSTEAK